MNIIHLHTVHLHQVEPVHLRIRCSLLKENVVKIPRDAGWLTVLILTSVGFCLVAYDISTSVLEDGTVSPTSIATLCGILAIGVLNIVAARK